MFLFRKIYRFKSLLVSAVLLFSFLHTSLLQAQNNTGSEDEKQAIENMKKDGVSDAAIQKWILERKLIYPNGTHTSPLNQAQKSQNVNAVGFCGDMGAENGWSVWEAATGDYLNGVITLNATGLVPTAPRFNIKTGVGVDPCTPGTAPGAPPITYVAPPGFGNSTIELGEPNSNGNMGLCSSGCVEQLTFNLKVTPADTNFIYAYAILLENPLSLHTGKQVPFAEIYILDQNGDTVNCSHHKYMGDSTGMNTIPPGMYQASCPGPSGNGNDVMYQPWTIYGINLVSYIGQTVKVVITNADCGLGGHFCYSYWDFLCPPVSGSMVPYCLGQQTTIVGPGALPGVPLTYTWYQNGHVYTGPPSASSQTITPTPTPGDTFSVYVQLPSGCNYWIPFAPVASTIVPEFSYSGNCGYMHFKDSSFVSPPSATNSVVAWAWQFPGGTPSFSFSQNPGTIFYPKGTYTVTLIAVSKAGCVDTISHVILVDPPLPVAAFIPSTPCLGAITSLADASVQVTNDPVTSWSWSIPGGSPTTSTAQNAATVYYTAGTHSVTLIVTSQYGCKDTVVQPVQVYNPPVADFGGTAKGCAPVCNNYLDSSTSVDGNIVSWQWSFPGGNPMVSSVQNPSNICYSTPGDYGASLIVTTIYGCRDTADITPLVNVYPWPQADFCVEPNPASVIDPVFYFCDLWSSDVTQWSWNFGDNSPLDTVKTHPVHSYSSSVTSNDFYSYDVCIRVETQHGCWDTICHPVKLVPEFTFYIPNTFTPNGDFHNEVFFGKSRGVKEYNIWLFDRWGNMIWDCHHSGVSTDWDNFGQDGMAAFCKWDGKVVEGGVDMNGNSRFLAQEDVYVWKVKLTDVFGKEHTYVGNVNVVR
jgi:PKD repeat protein